MYQRDLLELRDHEVVTEYRHPYLPSTFKIWNFESVTGYTCCEKSMYERIQIVDKGQ